jgi:hypothetical protein
MRAPAVRLTTGRAQHLPNHRPAERSRAPLRPGFPLPYTIAAIELDEPPWDGFRPAGRPVRVSRLPQGADHASALRVGIAGDGAVWVSRVRVGIVGRAPHR